MDKVINSQLIAESEYIEALRFEYIESKPKLKIYEKNTSKLVESIESKGKEKDLIYILNNYPNTVSCIED